LGQAYSEVGDGTEALKWFRRAVAEAPNTREPWVELAMACYRRELWAESLSSALTALEIKEKALVYTMDPSVWTEKPYDLASIAAWKLGMKEMARQMCVKAIEFAPSDSRLLKNLELMTEAENG
jgi:Flp pilus assembly protein TadD